MKLEDQLKQLFVPSVEEMMKNETPPPNSLVSPKSWRKKKKEELLDFYSGKKDFDRVNAAIKELQTDFSSSLSPIEMDKLTEEWERGLEKINALFETPQEVQDSIPAVPLCRMMNLSDSFMETFYSAGVKYFQKQDFTKAADIFFLLSLIDFQRHAIWVSLGLSEMMIGEFEPALNAFAMASITNSMSPYPFIHSAECCIALSRFQEASTYFDLAKEAISNSAPKEKESLMGQITSLEQKNKL